MMKLNRKPGWLLFSLILPVALAACSEEKTAQGGGQAGGEVLEGTISDAMIPLDTVRSQAPLAPRAVTDGDAIGDADTGKSARKTVSRTSPVADEVKAPASPEAQPAEATPGEE